MTDPSTSELELGLERVRSSPREQGPVELIVRRPGVGEREELETASIDLEEGLVGDGWRARGSRATPDGSADREAQLTVMNVRAAALVAGSRERWALAGDQIYADLDLSVENLPPGTRLRLGSALIVVSATPHTGCAKFRERFGSDGLRFVNAPHGRALRLRGLNARIVEPGVVRVGDTLAKL
jgi:hypothetical protein